MLPIEEGFDYCHEQEEWRKLEDKRAYWGPMCGEGFGRPEEWRDSGCSSEDQRRKR